MTDKTIARFWSKVCKTDGCWEWHASLHRDGYATFEVSNGPRTARQRKQWLVHRLSYELANGKIPDGLFVCHSCDNRKCVNPAHLWLGTHQDNVDDRETKGRNKTLSLEDHSMALLSCESANEIRTSVMLGAKPIELAKMLGVSKHTVYDVLAGRSWVSQCA